MNMHQILVYADSLSWGLIPGTRSRLPFSERWPGILEGEMKSRGVAVRIVEDCLNGRRTVWDDPFKAGRNGIQGIEQRMEVNSPLSLVILMLGANDFQAVHQLNAFQSAQGLSSMVTAIRRAPVEPGMPVPPILLVSPPPPLNPVGPMAEKFAGADERSIGLSAAIRQVANDHNCHFFDAGEVVKVSRVDGVHLDADQHPLLGKALVDLVIYSISTG